MIRQTIDCTATTIPGTEFVLSKRTYYSGAIKSTLFVVIMYLQKYEISLSILDDASVSFSSLNIHRSVSFLY